MRLVSLTAVPFRESADAWLETRKPYLSVKTIHEYALNIKTLSVFFGEMRLPEITADQIRAYQKMRLTQCGPFSINHECTVLQQMLKRIGRWAEIAPNYQALPLPKQKRGRALRDEQKKNLMDVAASNPGWEAAFIFAMISVNTTAGPKETMTLRRKDVDLDRRILVIQPEGAKNIHRIRPIPLNDEAFRAVEMALARAQRIGSTDPNHYIFPFRIKGNAHKGTYDPIRHQTSFKTAWLKMVAQAKLPGFRMYDLRHHAITSLLENPKVSEETVESIAGHISREIKKRYSHVRIENMRTAVTALYAPEKKPVQSVQTVQNVSAPSNTDLANELLQAIGKLLKFGGVSSS